MGLATLTLAGWLALTSGNTNETTHVTTLAKCVTTQYYANANDSHLQYCIEKYFVVLLKRCFHEQ